MLNRRTFLKSSVTALPLASLSALPQPAEAEGSFNSGLVNSPLPPALFAAATNKPWESTVRRIGQVNFTEHDPVELNVEEWADYWHGLKVDLVFVSVTGIIAFYPTNVPFFRRSQFLNNRDLFGECAAAAKKRGMRVVARMSPDLNWPDALTAHPEWAIRNRQGEVQHSPEDPRLFRTCMFSTYMTDYIPAVMREVNSRYDTDAIYTNGWPPLGNLQVCYCQNCKDLPAPGTPAYWDKFNDRVFYLWKLYDGIAKEKKPTNFYFANMGGGVHAGPNLSELGKLVQWFQSDSQGRGAEDDPIWDCALQGRVCSAVMDGKPAAGITGAYSTGPVRWRNASKSPAEATMWLNQSVASGMIAYYHWIGAEKGLGEDRRWLKTGSEYYSWLAKHDIHFTTKRSVANIGVLIGQRTNLFYKPPTGAHNQQFVQGMYYALLEGRFAFDFVHEERLQPERLSKYRALILPNTALLSDEQCHQLAAYVQAGGSLLATFESGMYDEHNVRRQNSGLAEIFGTQVTGPVVPTNGNAYYARIEQPQHPVLAGFNNTNWLPGAQNRLPIAPIQKPVLTVVPGFVAYPPELAYPPKSHTDEPALVLREQGKSRLAYHSGDIDRTLWHSGHTDLTQLLQNLIRWVSDGESPCIVEGDGLIETLAWETEAGYAVHLLNYTNPNTHRGWLRKTYPLSQQKVRLSVHTGSRIRRVQLLRSGSDIPFHVQGDVVAFTVPRIDDYEVAAVYTS